MKMEPDKIYKVSEITVNADELRRVRDAVDEHLAAGLDIYRRLDNLIKQGTTPIKHANKKEEAKSSSKDGHAEPSA